MKTIIGITTIAKAIIKDMKIGTDAAAVGAGANIRVAVDMAAVGIVNFFKSSLRKEINEKSAHFFGYANSWKLSFSYDSGRR